jgi:hypothetical protein
MVLMPPRMAAKASIICEKLIFSSEGETVWEDEAMSGKPTGMVGGMGISSSESSRSPQLCIRLHQSMLADGLLNLHLRFSNNVDA